MTVICTVLLPVLHVAALPFVTDIPSTVITTVAITSSGVAVIVFVAFVVLAV